ncbi:DUF6461 domain-containing protein [Gordonia terrae]|uniref:DUF6461 domain-containing protein n=1 Tax=Gordonia hongkongensis TaxID=1701090 RepID=UPI0022B2D1D4|nr:DUF6461 domain-containing protein [Gordonia terrae]
MTTTYRDYLWFNDDEFAGWRATGHVVSLIREATADGILDALSAYSRRTRGIGLDGFGKRAQEFELLGLVPMMSQAVQTVGVADIGDGWVLLIQHNSEYLGVTDELFRPVIDNHEVVSHFSNVNANSRFVWWRGGQQQISFEPMFATWDLDRARSIPVTGSSTLYDLMSEVGGFQLGETDEPRTEFFHLEASFALAERITGIAVTKELIESAEFTVALVPTTTEPQTPYAHEMPPRVPLLGDRATWSEVHQLYRSAGEATVHATMVLSEGQQGSEERHEVEFWYSPFQGMRQVDSDGLLSVNNPDGHWHRGPYAPDTSPDQLVGIHHRWDQQTPFRLVIDPTSLGTATEVNGRRAWEFVLPPYMFGPVAVAFDAHTGIPLRAESNHRTEELLNITLDEPFSEDLFTIPE